MTALAIITYIGFALLVIAVALALIAVLGLLRRILFTLGTINVGLRSIARRVEPLEPILGEVNTDLAGVRDALAAVLQARQPSSEPKELVS